MMFAQFNYHYFIPGITFNEFLILLRTFVKRREAERKREVWRDRKKMRKGQKERRVSNVAVCVCV